MFYIKPIPTYTINPGRLAIPHSEEKVKDNLNTPKNINTLRGEIKFLKGEL